MNASSYRIPTITQHNFALHRALLRREQIEEKKYRRHERIRHVIYRFRRIGAELVASIRRPLRSRARAADVQVSRRTSRAMACIHAAPAKIG